MLSRQSKNIPFVKQNQKKKKTVPEPEPLKYSEPFYPYVSI